MPIVKVSQKHQITLPRVLRQKLNIDSGDYDEMVVMGGVVPSTNYTQTQASSEVWIGNVNSGGDDFVHWCKAGSDSCAGQADSSDPNYASLVFPGGRRMAHTLTVFKKDYNGDGIEEDRIWLIGGQANVSGGLKNDIWYWSKDDGWVKWSSSVPFGPIASHQVVVY
ncbi:MAG: AbrB/MazE/SpoVT family DNA-binding domain-containing protein, partial [Thermodesulfobacteriota bacterium]